MLQDELSLWIHACRCSEIDGISSRPTVPHAVFMWTVAATLIDTRGSQSNSADTTLNDSPAMTTIVASPFG